MSDAFLLALNLYFAGVLGVSGLAKLDNRLSFEVTLSRYRLLPDWAPRPVSLVFPWLELMTAATVAFGLAPVTFASVTAGLFVGFVGIEGLLILSGKRVNCGCYGAALGRRVDSASFVTSLLLAALACANLWLTIDGHKIDGFVRYSTALLLTGVLTVIGSQVAGRNFAEMRICV